ncbi:MAG: beta-lactamase family protein, partial [Acidimicrobiaceae bacterium]|nr:beta-lactamase family protein [Acidimicrobiaceae bacterium]
STTCLGLADQSSSREITHDTVFRIASISKTLTALGLMQLYENGLFELDNPVNNYLKSFRIEAPVGGTEVTFRHLLTHTAGIGEMPRSSELISRAAWGMDRPGSPPADLAIRYRGALRPEVAAGTKWAYANHGFAVVGQLVEDIAGRPLADYMREHVFDRLGMASTDYQRSERVASAMAVGYHWKLRGLRAVKDYDVTLLGPGAALSSLSDMIRYTEAILAGGTGAAGRVVRPETLAEMLSPQYSPDPRLPGLGLAFFLDRFGEHRVAGHDGNLPGFASALLVAPDEGIGVVVLTNNSTMIGAHLLAASLMRSQLGVDDPASCLPRPDVSDRPHLWPELTGHYAPRPGFLTNLRTWQATAGEVQIMVKDRRLVLRALSPLPSLRKGLRLCPIDDSDPFLFAVNVEGLFVPIAFQPAQPGRDAILCVGAPALATLHRRPAWRSSRRRLQSLTLAGLAAATLRRLRSRR